MVPDRGNIFECEVGFEVIERPIEHDNLGVKGVGGTWLSVEYE